MIFSASSVGDFQAMRASGSSESEHAGDRIDDGDDGRAVRSIFFAPGPALAVAVDAPRRSLGNMIPVRQRLARFHDELRRVRGTGHRALERDPPFRQQLGRALFRHHLRLGQVFGHLLRAERRAGCHENRQ